MTVPLVILAVFSALAGFIGLPVLFGERADLFGRFLERVLGPAAHHLARSTEAALIARGDDSRLWPASAWPFSSTDVRPTLRRAWLAASRGLYRLLLGKYYVDEAYDAVVVRPLVRGAGWVYEHFDLKVIDGALNGSAAAAGLAGKGLNILQSGLVRDYALAFLMGAILFLGFLLL